MSIANKDSLFFVSLPKSGTIYTWYSLCDTTGLKMPEFNLLEGWESYQSGRDFSCPELYACGDYNTQLLRPEQMKHYLKGHIFGAHMQASYHNMKILEESGIDRISVLLRDPRDAFVSWVHHLNELGLPARNYHSRIYHIPSAYYDWPLERQFDYQVRSFLATTINWVEGWLDYYASPDRKIAVNFVLYDELKRNPAGYVKRIVDFHDIEEVDYAKLIVPEQGKMHFRKGEHEQWRVDFSPGNQRLALDLLQDRILENYAAAARSHAGVGKAEHALAQGQPQAAMHHALAAIGQFSSSKQCYDLFVRGAEQAGVDVSGLQQKILEELGSLSISGCFLYRDDLVDECTKIMQESSAPVGA